MRTGLSENRIHVSLEPASEDHLDFLYSLACETEPAWLRVSRGGVPLPPEFVRRLHERVERQFIVLAEGELLVGAAALYSMNADHRMAFAEVVISPDCASTSVVEAAAFDLLLDTAFGEYGLATVLVRYAEWCPPSMSSRWATQRHGLLEGELRHLGQLWSVGLVGIAPKEEAP